MKYTPKLIEGNVNVSQTSPIREVLLLIGGLLGVLVLVYILLGFAVEWVAPRLPYEFEAHLGSVLNSAFIAFKSFVVFVVRTSPNNGCFIIFEYYQNHCTMNVNIEKVKSIAMHTISIGTCLFYIRLISPLSTFNI